MKFSFSILLILLVMQIAYADEKSDHYETRFFKPTLIYAATGAEINHGDPMAEAKTPEQRQFLKEYLRVGREQSEALRKDPTYRYMEPLRRCGINFPAGTIVMWLPFATPLKVVHTPETIKKIEKYMGLTPDPPKSPNQTLHPTALRAGCCKSAVIILPAQSRMLLAQPPRLRLAPFYCHPPLPESRG